MTYAEALAAAREALANDPVIRWFEDDRKGESAVTIALRDLLAAIDAQKPVAWRSACGKRFYRSRHAAELGGERVYEPLYAAPPAADEVADEYARAFHDGWLACKRGDAEPPAPPAAAVPAWSRESVMALWKCARTHNGTIPDDELDAMRDALLAAPPAAAVPAGYAEAIKAVQEMMPPRDFRPSAQVWLTGNQVNELHARLDAAAMLATQAPPAAVVPEGYALVPVEPTESMVDSGRKELGALYGHEGARNAYRAMLAAQGVKS